MATSRGQSLASAGKVYFTRSAYRLEWEMDLSGLVEGRKDAPRGMIPTRPRIVFIQKHSDPDHTLHLNDQRRTYAVTDLKKLREEAANLPKTTYTVTKLGNDTVAGVSCVKALVKSSSGTEVEMCVATDLVGSFSWVDAMNRRDSSNSMLKALRDNGLIGFPVRMVTRGRGKSEMAMIMELVRFEKKSLPSSLFEIPAGYTQTSESYLNLTPEQEKMMREGRQRTRPSTR